MAITAVPLSHWAPSKGGLWPKQAVAIDVLNFRLKFPSAHKLSNICCSVHVEGLPGKILRKSCNLKMEFPVMDLQF